MQIVPLILTFLISAAWHGMEISFFKMFFFLGLMDVMYKTWD